MKLCLQAGKHVLCEKPFTINATQAAECVALARQKQLFLMEAMWMKFIPAVQQAMDWVADGRLGDIRLVQGHFSWPVPYDSNSRIYDPALAGGALLEMGIYPATLAHMVLGKPDTMLAHAHLCETGVDDLNTAVWVYNHGAQAVLTSSQQLFRPGEIFITGTKGYLKLHHLFFRSEKLTLQLGWDGEAEVIQLPLEGNGYEYQVRHVQNCIRAEKIESEVVRWSDTIEIMGLLDQMRADWGLKYPDEM